MVLAPVVRGRKGEYGKVLRGAARRGLRARQGRRRAADARGRDRARQEVQARHRGGRRPPGHARRACASAWPTRSRRRSALADGHVEIETVPREGEGAGTVTLFSEKFACLDRGTVDPRARAADLLVQHAARRLPALHRPGLADGDRPRARRARPGAVDRRGRDRAVGQQRVATTTSRSPQAIADDATSIDLERAVGGAARRGSSDLFLYGTDGERVKVTYRNRYGRRRSYATRFEGIVAEPRAALPRDRLRARRARRSRSTCRCVPCPACKGSRLRPESRAVSVGGMAIHEFTALSVSRARCDWLDEVELTRDRAPHRAADPARDRRAAALPRQRRHRLPVAGPRGGDAVGRRGAAHPAGDADRLGAGRRALRPRRAVDRPAPARQREADRDARAAARPRQHRARRRARRADDARRRLPRRPRARAPASTAAAIVAAGHGRRGRGGRGVADGPVPAGARDDRGAGEAAHADRLRSRSAGARAAQPARTSTSASRSAC